MDVFLTPIEKPAHLMMKLVYFFTRKQFGKVLMPLKVHSVRLPMAFGMFYGKVSQLDKKLVLSQATALLIRQQVARINVCLFCVDASRYALIQASLNEQKFNSLDDYNNSPAFTEAERAALDYATQLTKEKKVSSDIFKRLTKHYSEREICELVWLVASEHLYNLTNLGLNIHSDMLCTVKKQSS